MSDRLFSLVFIVIAFFVLGFTISKAVFKSSSSTEKTASVAAPLEIPRAELEEPTDFDESNHSQEKEASTTVEVVVPVEPVEKVVTVTITETPTGWLNVREGPAVSYNMIKKINPGESYTFLEEKTGWYKIKLGEEKEGWIASQYANKN